MRLHLLGTGSPAGWPMPLCQCDVCEQARRRGGPNLRGRPGALIDDDLKIDFGADTFMQLKQSGRDLIDLKTILFTHQHDDHVAPEDLNLLANLCVQVSHNPIEIWGNAATIAKIRDKITNPQRLKLLEIHTIQAGDVFTTACGDQVLAMPARHVEGAVLFRITRNGRTLFYGHDSGPYPQPTLETLADGVKLDIALFDCTYGAVKKDKQHHMGIDDVIEMADKLRQSGAVTDRTRCIATHFSHIGGLPHEELVRTFLPHGIEVAYDGMLVAV